MCGKVQRNGEIRVEPIVTAKVEKDLVYDMNAHLWDKVKAVKPGISVNGAPATQEASIDQKTIDDLQNVMSCYMCGLCDDGCTVIAVDRTFLGPAALATAYRTIRDPRAKDTDKNQILDTMDMPKGAWDCAHCYEANAHCPRDVTPTYRIVAVRDQLIKRGIKHGGAGRHHRSAMASIKASGWLDEGRITIDSIGWTNIPGLMAFMPVAITALRRGKAPLPFVHERRPGAEHIRRIIEKAERHG
jgi:succinate dehydrogenase / fumarate reductase iron-sulfur subunit